MPRKTYDLTIPDLTGHRAVVTGASDGIGLGIATALAGAGAEVVMPVRKPSQGRGGPHDDPHPAPRSEAQAGRPGPVLSGVRRGHR